MPDSATRERIKQAWTALESVAASTPTSLQQTCLATCRQTAWLSLLHRHHRRLQRTRVGPAVKRPAHQTMAEVTVPRAPTWLGPVVVPSRTVRQISLSTVGKVNPPSMPCTIQTLSTLALQPVPTIMLLVADQSQLEQQLLHDVERHRTRKASKRNGVVLVKTIT